VDLQLSDPGDGQVQQLSLHSPTDGTVANIVAIRVVVVSVDTYI
jgi:hypothetical protein